MRTYKEDHKLMELLGLKEVNRVICDTNMGPLKLRLRKGENEYRFTLDAVELPKALNKQTMELLFPVTIELPTNNLESHGELIKDTNIRTSTTIKQKAKKNTSKVK